MVNSNKALEVIEFVQALKHTGDFYGKPFVLLPWQIGVINSVYGTVTAEGVRQYRMAYLEIAKKNGKTELIAALSLYHLVMDAPGGEIYCGAADRNQASIAFNAAKSMVEQSEVLSKIIKIKDSTKEMLNLRTHSRFKVLSAEAATKHGLNPSVVIIDELHAHPKRDLWDVLTFGTGAARNEQLIWCITTAGDDPDRKSVGWEQHEIATKVLSGELTDPAFYAKIYTVPEDADIYDEANWYLANPSLGVSIKIENVRSEAIKARNSPAAEKLFRWLRLNQWISLKRTGWLPITLWDDTEGGWHKSDMLGRPCYVGIDLSSTTDLTAVAALFPPPPEETEWRFFLDAWIPEENMREREHRDHVPFSKWVQAGHMHATPGNCVDYAYIANYLDKLMLDYDIKYIAADEWRIDSLRPLMQQEVAAQKIITIPQTMSGMSPAMKEIERLLREGEMTHERNPCGRWAFGNVVVAQDGNENIKPMKNRSIERIDPMCALIDAMAAAVKLEPKRSVYEHRGLRIV